ncbi:MAG: hypothetical protein KJI69_04440 [Patescibacteria group bacterium]|nr:hypothetical protein [Patescibacteria group bacterium]
MNLSTRRKKFILNANLSDYKLARFHLNKYYESIIAWDKRYGNNHTLDELLSYGDKSFIKMFEIAEKKFLEGLKN